MNDLDVYDDVAQRLRDGFAPVGYSRDVRSLRPPRKSLRATGGTVALVGLVALALVATGGPDRALRGPDPAWSATPVELPDPVVSDLVAGCEEFYNTDHRVDGEEYRDFPDVPDLLDYRGGDYAFALFDVYGGHDRPAVCEFRLDGNGEWKVSDNELIAGYGSVIPPPPPGWDPVIFPTYAAFRHYAKRGGTQPPYAISYGFAGPTVKEVIVDAADTDVHATVANGYYAAFWPEGSADASALARALNGDGEVVWEGDLFQAQSVGGLEFFTPGLAEPPDNN